mmetsp:Transcript_63634/g.186150  ORF Transcript_63634/g.186150 Transcript_63634/m.186150 type:complete len:298 (-) Transcript_63634:655-1548(-)
MGSPGDPEAVLAVDEAAGGGHADQCSLVEHPLGTDAGLHRAFDVPDFLVLGGHAGAVEAGVQHDHRHLRFTKLLGHQHAPYVAGCPGHVVAVVAALALVLRGAPLSRARLAGDDHHLRPLQQVCSFERGNASQGSKSTDINLLDGLCVLNRAEVVDNVREVTCIENDEVHRSCDLRGHLLQGLRVRHLHVRDDLLHANRLQLRRWLSARGNGFSTQGHKLRGDAEAQALACPHQDHALALEGGGVVHGGDVQEPIVLVLRGLCNAGLLVCHTKDALFLGRRLGLCFGLWLFGLCWLL